MAKKLTAGVLQGKQYTETIEVELGQETYELEITPLNNKEATEIEVLSQEGVSVKGKPGRGGKMERIMDFDTKKNAYGRNAGNIKAIAYGTVDESLTEEVIAEQFPHKLVKEISERIKEISGIGNQDEVGELNESPRSE